MIKHNQIELMLYDQFEHILYSTFQGTHSILKGIDMDLYSVLGRELELTLQDVLSNE